MSLNDEIRISIQNLDSYNLPSESYIYIEGIVNVLSTGIGKYSFINNGLASLLSELRYELNGVEIQKLKSPGISSSLKGYYSHTPNVLNELENIFRDSDIEEKNKSSDKNIFTGCIPFKNLFIKKL